MKDFKSIIDEYKQQTRHNKQEKNWLPCHLPFAFTLFRTYHAFYLDKIYKSFAFFFLKMA